MSGERLDNIIKKTIDGLIQNTSNYKNTRSAIAKASLESYLQALEDLVDKFFHLHQDGNECPVCWAEKEAIKIRKILRDK